MSKPLIVLFSFLTLLCTACGQAGSSKDETIRYDIHSITAANVSKTYKKGDIVPNNEVCMVNDAFMGKPQIEVSHDGKTYYGCCEMCKARIQQDESVRMAVEPVSKKQLDKAKAFIAITGDKGEVSYFENMTNYKVFFDK